MILELAEIDILPGKEPDFEAILEEASRLFLQSPGCLGIRIGRSIEHPHRFRLLVRWATLDDHMIGFRNSDAFIEWRRLAGPCFAKPPRVEHMNLLIGD
ncbi:hypothetical protein ACFB49_05360 [Sphingomonas sp. DBB INV C78]